LPVVRSIVGLLPLASGLRPRPHLVVVGDAVADACLALCWDRTFGEGTVVWLPGRAPVIDPTDGEALARDEDAARLLYYACEALDEPPDQLYAGTWLTSTSIPHTELAPITELLRSAAPAWMQRLPDRLDGLQVVAPQQLPADVPHGVLACSDAFALSATLPFGDDGIAQQSISSPIPSLLRRNGNLLAGGITGPWIAEAQVDECPLPPRQGAADASASGADPEADGPTVRASKSGACWPAVADFQVPDEVAAEHALARARLREPHLELLLDTLLAESGYAHQLSDAGRFYQGMTDMLGGLPGLLQVLRDTDASAVLHLFLNEGTSKAAPGLVLQDGRRYARLSDCRRAARGVRGQLDATDRGPRVGDMRALLDRLLEAGVLVRGLVLKCSRCRHTAFHPLGEASTTFICQRCAHLQHLVSESWCHTPPHEPALFYRLDELVLMALRFDVTGPAFAVDALGGSRREARVLWSTELRHDGQRSFEVDFVVLVDGRLATGEAKINGKLGRNRKQADQEVNKTVAAAQLLRADDVAFATTTTWNRTAREAIAAGTSGARLRCTHVLEYLK